MMMGLIRSYFSNTLITGLAGNATKPQRMLYRWAIRAGTGSMRGLASLMVLSAIRGELGFGKLRVAYVGDGPVSDEITKWARALGITVRHIKPGL